MMNPFVLPMKNGPEWIEPQQSKYSFFTEPPERIGDDALIVVDGKRIKVRLHESKNGFMWLVKM